jgi:hypothetical protein
MVMKYTKLLYNVTEFPFKTLQNIPNFCIKRYRLATLAQCCYARDKKPLCATTEGQLIRNHFKTSNCDDDIRFRRDFSGRFRLFQGDQTSLWKKSPKMLPKPLLSQYIIYT